MTREEALELIPLYAVGALEVNEARVVEDFMRDASAEERHELTEWQNILAMLPLALSEVAPPEQLRARLLDRIAQGAEDQEGELVYRITEGAEAAPVKEASAKVLPFTPARKFESDPQRWLLIAASVLLACTSAFFLWRSAYVTGQRDVLAADRDRAAKELESKKQENEGLVASLKEASRIILMAGVETPQANAKVLWNEEQKVWDVFIFNLPAPPSDMDYQLWYVTDNQKISARVFSTDSKGQFSFSLQLPPQALKGLAATAVTLEPKGGSPQPTGKFYLKAAI